MTVGSLKNEKQIRDIVSACGTDYGFLMQVNSDNIKEAFSQVKNQIVTGQLNVESF